MDLGSTFLSDLRGFLLIVGISIIGIILMRMRNRKDYNKYTAESLELLVLMMMPVVQVIPLISEPKENLYLFTPIYFGVLLIWHTIGMYITTNPSLDTKLTRPAFRSNIRMWIYLVAIGIIVQWMLVSLIPLVTQSRI